MTVEMETSKGKKTMTGGVMEIDEATIAEQKAKEAGRKPAPKVKATTRMVDYRKKMIDELNARQDGYYYAYANPNITDWDLEVKQAEVVKDDKGKKLHFRGDPIIRRKQSEVDAERVADSEFSEELLKSVVKNDQTSYRRKRKEPKNKIQK